MSVNDEQSVDLCLDYLLKIDVSLYIYLNLYTKAIFALYQSKMGTFQVIFVM